ncbi:MAG: transporter substrate-binding domain-containing protein [Proteobacteria bacterium]|nr:transporter substrate-binding domain-containing protein [Pseudomonadota bacterium]
MICKHKPSLLLLNVVFGLLMASILLMTTVSEGGQDKSFEKTPASNAFLQSLTEKEQVWLRDHPVIRTVQDPGWPPVEFTNTLGEPTGMAEDYLSLIEQRLGVKFERIKNLSWQEAYSRLKRWEIDMTTSVAMTPIRAEFWAFTKPYMKIPIVIVAHADVTYISDMRELAGKKVAVVDGYAVNDWIPRDFPEIQLVRVKTAQEGLETLQRKEVFAYIENMLVVGYHMAKLKLTTLKIAGETPYVNNQCMAVRKDWVILAGILQKALDSITESERNGIYRKWLPIRYEHGFNYTLLWQALATFAVILLVLVLWIRRLSREIMHRKNAEVGANESARHFSRLFDVVAMPLCLIDKNGVLINLNERFVQTFGYKREDVATFAEWRQLAFPDPDYRRWVIDTWETAVKRAAAENTDIEPIEYRVKCKNGEERTVIISGTIIGDNFLAAFFDITERKLAEDSLLENEKKYRLIADNSNDWIYLIYPDGKFKYVSPSSERFTGYASEEFINNQQLFMDIIHPDDKEHIKSHFEFIKENTTDHDLEFRIITKEGELRWIRHSCLPVYNDEGQYVGRSGTNREITNRKLSEEQLKQTHESLRMAFNTTIQVMVSAVEVRDPYTAGHQIRTANVACAIAKEMGFSKEKIENIRIAGSIHDIGKLSIPSEILSKPSKLSEIEFSLIKTHSRSGYEILKDVESSWPLAEIVYQHHERIDGSGYPRNLKGDEILIEARILAVADVIEAMASHRPYRPGLGIDSALDEIEKNKGIFYDKAAADACLRLFREKGFQIEKACSIP